VSLQERLGRYKVASFGEAHGAAFSLAAYDPSLKPFSRGSKQRDLARTDELGAKLEALQEMLHASHQQSVLLILQGMDTSGKDGTIRTVLRVVDPLGVRIESFRAPSEGEQAHDFLWRVHARVPGKGELGVFNRSHYEDVLVPFVKGQLDETTRAKRFRQIRDFELMLHESGTALLKCFLHIGFDTQRERLQSRIDHPDKNWKFDLADLEARQHWDDYQLAYEAALAATSTDHAPWYVIPADSKPHRSLMVAELLHQTMSSLGLRYPPSRPELAGIKVK
jgi:PPK2 family polyphosphate:nucleotide phosphotransferase